MVGTVYSIYRCGAPGTFGERLARFVTLKLELRWGEPSIWTIESTGLERSPLQIGDGITIYRDRDPFLDGVVESVTESRDETEGGATAWSATGRDLTSWLERRLVLPDPVGLRFDESLQDVFRGAPEMAVRAFARRNIGAWAAPERAQEGLDVEELTNGLGSALYAYRLTALSEVIRDIGGGELTVGIRRDRMTGRFLLETIRRRELADEVFFSAETGTVLRWSKTSRLPKMNAVWAAGAAAF